MYEYRDIAINEHLYNLFKVLISEKKVLIVHDNEEKEETGNNNKIIEYKDKKEQLLMRKILNNIDKIMNLYKGFNKNYNNITLNQLYKITDEEFTKNKKSIVYYTTIRNYVTNKNDDEIMSIYNYLKKENVISNYCKYKKFVNNKKLSIVKKNVSIKDLNLVISKLSAILNNEFAFQPQIHLNKYTKVFVDTNIDINNCSDEDLLDLAAIANYQYNNKLLKCDNKYPLYNPMHYVYNALNIKNTISNRKKYSLNENAIFEEYKENIDNLKIYYNSFSFIGEAINHEQVEEMKEYLLDEQELFSYFTNIKKILVCYRDFLDIKKEIEKLDDDVIDLLNTFYVSVNNERELINLIDFIPQYYSYSKIDEIEKKEHKTINDYENINKYYEELKYAINSFKAMAELSIRSKSKQYDLTGNQCCNNIDHEIYTVNYNSIINNDNILEHKPKYETEAYLIGNIFKVISSLGYSCKIYDDVIMEVEVNNNKKLYLVFDNNIDIFKRINAVIKLMLEDKKIIFVWSRDWWLDKSDEINKIKNILNEF